jgi:hypothetical protein
MNLLPKSTKALESAGYDPRDAKGKASLYALVNLAAYPPERLTSALFPSDDAYTRATWVNVRTWKRFNRLLVRACAAAVTDQHLASVVPSTKHGALDYTVAGGWRLIPLSKSDTRRPLEYRAAACTALQSAIFEADRKNRRKYLKRRPVLAASLPVE